MVAMATNEIGTTSQPVAPVLSGEREVVPGGRGGIAGIP
jgi:hypothetical protein